MPQQQAASCIIPPYIWQDKELSPAERALAGRIHALSARDGHCWATNKWLANDMGIGERTVRQYLATLEQRCHLRKEVAQGQRKLIPQNPNLIAQQQGRNTHAGVANLAGGGVANFATSRARSCTSSSRVPKSKTEEAEAGARAGEEEENEEPDDWRDYAEEKCEEWAEEDGDSNPEDGDPPPEPPYTEIMDYWNEQERLSTYHPCVRMTDKRKKHLRARWKEELFRENWRTIIDKCEQSDFLVKKCNPFDFTWWIRNDSNYCKILEGRYSDEQESGW